MATWVTFSNGEQACQTIPSVAKQNALAEKLGIPFTVYSFHRYIDLSKATTEQQFAWKEAYAKILDEEAQEYIKEKWPDGSVTVKQRQTLPYGSSPSFGSGSRGGHFCYTPRQCAGYSSCPKSYACSE